MIFEQALNRKPCLPTIESQYTEQKSSRIPILKISKWRKMLFKHNKNEPDDVRGIIKEVLKISHASRIQTFSKIDSPEELQKQVLREAQNLRELQKEIAEILALRQQIEKLIQKNSPKDVWWEKLPKFLPDNREIIRHELSESIENLTLAIQTLHQSSENVYFAKYIRFETEKTICKYKHPHTGFFIKWFLQIYHSPSVPIKVLSGLISAIFLYGSIAFGIIVIDWSRATIGEFFNSTETSAQIDSVSNTIQKIKELSRDPKNLNPEVLKNAEVNLTNYNNYVAQQKLKPSPYAKRLQALDEIALALLGGILGSIISILIRIEQFKDRSYLDPMTPFLIGAVKPIIGGGFGLLFLAFINSQIFLNILNPTVFKFTNDLDQKKSMIFAVAFIIGFSERLAKDTIGKAEDILGSRQTVTESRQTNFQSQESEGDSTKELNIQEETTATQTIDTPSSTPTQS